MSISLEPLGQFYSNNSEVTEILQTAFGLRIVLRINIEENSEYLWSEYFFDGARGFRVLDEGDLLPFWRAESYKTGYALHRVYSGGWLEQEKNSGNLTTTSSMEDDVKEWLITSGMNCVNIISTKPPQIRQFT